MPGLYTATQRAGSKAININQFPEEAWSIVLGTGTEDGDLQELWKKVPWLNRGIGILASGLSKMPFTITDLAGEEVDNSSDYQNVMGFWPNPTKELALTEAALKLFGTAYFIKDNPSLMRRDAAQGSRGIRYWVPVTVEPIITDKEGLTGFVRNLPGREPETFAVDDLIHVWEYDPFGEIGEPSWSPAMAALSAAGVLKSIDDFVELFMKRGAIKTTLLTIMGGVQPAERERIGAMWGRMMQGMKTAWNKLTANADALKPVVIGEGLESLSNTSLTNEKREDIATALGVPQSLLFSNASNFAVAESDKRNLYEETIIPDSDLIAEEFNEQWLEPLGFRIRFDAQTMDIFQEDEEDRSGVIVNLTNAIVNSPNGKIASIVWQTAGAELPPDIDYDEFEKLVDESKENAAPVNGGAENVPAPSARPVEGTVPEEEDDPDAKALDIDLSKWRRKCVNRLLKGQPAACAFDSDYIPAKLYGLIREMLEEAKTEADVRNIFMAEAV